MIEPEARSPTFTAEAHRDGDWWVVHIPELDVTTQAADEREIVTQARGVIAATLDLPEDAALNLRVITR